MTKIHEIKRNQPNEAIESRLQKEAQQIDSKVDITLRQQLLSQLATQTPIMSQPKRQRTSSHYITLVASFAFALALIPLSLKWNNEQLVHTNDVNLVSASDSKTESNPTLKQKPTRLIASHKLTDEYKAIVSDIEKLKTHLVRL